MEQLQDLGLVELSEAKFYGGLIKVGPSETSDIEDEEQGLFQELPKILHLARKYPGSLSCQTMGSMKESLVASSGQLRVTGASKGIEQGLTMDQARDDWGTRTEEHIEGLLREAQQLGQEDTTEHKCKPCIDAVELQGTCQEGRAAELETREARGRAKQAKQREVRCTLRDAYT